MTAEAPYTISIDRERQLIKLTLLGLWDLATVEQYVADAQRALAELTAAGKPREACRILIDLRQHGIQSREVTERVQAQLKDGLSDGARHAVLVSESALHKMQAQRVGLVLDAAFFTDESDALKWLYDRA